MGGGTFPKWKAGLSFHLVLGPLILRMHPTLGLNRTRGAGLSNIVGVQTHPDYFGNLAPLTSYRL